MVWTRKIRLAAIIRPGKRASGAVLATFGLARPWSRSPWFEVSYIWRKPGSLHNNMSPNGAVLFAVYRKPNLYYHAAKEAVGFEVVLSGTGRRSTRALGRFRKSQYTYPAEKTSIDGNRWIRK